MDDDPNTDEEYKNVENKTNDTTSAVNSLILEYYKKFGKKRDLEQFFSLSTAQSEIRDPSSPFWRRMKALSDSSDSGDKKSESSTELCRISISCSIPKPTVSQNQEETRKLTDSDSPPIITEVPGCSDNESDKSYDIQSHKSVDGTLDTSRNKPLSPTSSVTSQRKLEWDSLADVGYGNESDKKTSASSLSTLERLALQQQYCINDTQQSSLGLPTAHSTPLEPNDSKSKGKKDLIKKTTKIFNKEVDFIEMTLPQIPETSQTINLNLTKHIALNVDKKGEVHVENMTKNVSSSPEKAEKVSAGTSMTQEVKIDKEVQTNLTKEKSSSPHELPRNNPKFPVLVTYNTLKKRNRKKKLRKVRRKTKDKKEIFKESHTKDKSGDQISAAESFEYLPGHIYHQNQMNIDQFEINSLHHKIDNKSSLESSTGHNTDSSKDKNSFAKDIEKSIDLLKITLNKRHADDELKKKLIKEIVHRLLKTRYKDDDSTDFLSGLSFDSKKIDLGHTTTSTSDANESSDKKSVKPKKSILRTNTFNSKALPSTSQSTPNLPSVIKNEPVDVSFKAHAASYIESDPSKDAKTSSEELYQKYLKALRREQAYKQHLKDKEMLFKQKLVGSDMRINQQDVKCQNRIKDLMKDLVRNNYDDGSGDASRLEGGYNSNVDLNVNNPIRKQRSHSVFTLSSGTSDSQDKRSKKTEIGSLNTTCSKKEKHYCCCPFHTSGKLGVTDSSVQVNIPSCDNTQCSTKKQSNTNQKQKCDKCDKMSPNAVNVSTNFNTGDIRYVCLCKESDHQGVPDNILIYKCSRFDTGDDRKITPQSNCVNTQCCKDNKTSQNMHAFIKPVDRVQSSANKCLNVQESSSSKSSQTNLNLGRILQRKCTDKNAASTSTDQSLPSEDFLSVDKKLPKRKTTKLVHEAIRWTQTEISINPKISDPSFSDINIIDKKDCAKLVSEQYKEVSQENVKTSSDEISDLITDSSGKNLNTKISPKFTYEEKKKIDKDVQSDVDVSTLNNVGSQCNLLKQRKYSIPIEGTNMTLKVSLGDRESMSPVSRKPVQQDLTRETIVLESKETSTHKPTTVENSTSLLEECSVGIQSTDAKLSENIFKSTNEKLSSEKNLTKINAYLEHKFNTYPKENQINPLKPLLRSNTDTDRMEKSSHVTFDQLTKDNKESSEASYKLQPRTKAVSTEMDQEKINSASSENSSKINNVNTKSKSASDSESQTKSNSTSTSSNEDAIKDPLIDLIQDITKRYSKKDIEKSKRKKCFKEIITVLNYLLDTEDSSEHEQKASCSSTGEVELINSKESIESIPKETFVDKAVQLTNKPKSKKNTDSSDLPTSTDLPTTSTDSATCQVLNKIKKECERYHQKRCKSHANRKCEQSSSTSMNCDQCRRVHHCYCKGYKCHKTKAMEKNKKKCVAYNLILQSDSLLSEETVCESTRPLRDIIVKVPKRKYENVPFKEMSAKLERNLHNIPHCTRVHRSKSLPNDSEISSTDEMLRQAQAFSVREYLERNRPDFVEKCSQRQNTLKIINETSDLSYDRPADSSPRMNMIVVHTPKCNTNRGMGNCTMYRRGVPINHCHNCVNPYTNVQCPSEVTRIASQRAAKREMLSVQVEQQPTLNALSETELRTFAMHLGKQLRAKKLAPKFISERDMKKHSEKIYKSLPEVVRKKEEMKKESVKKTNLLLASIFKRNLQKKTLQGAVNLSNYSTVIKI